MGERCSRHFLHVISTSSCAFFGWEVCQSFGLQPPTMSHYKFLREDQRPIIFSSPQGRVNCIQYLIVVSFIFALCAHWCTHFSARRRRHISKTHFCQGGYVNEDAKTHFEDTLNEDEFPPEDELPREDTFRRHIKRRRISPRRRITSRRQISKTH